MNELASQLKISIHVNALTGGGAERVASLWASGFVRRGHSVTIVIRDDGRPVTYQPDPRVRVIRVGSRGGSKISKLFSRLRVTRRLLRRERPDVIIGVLENASLEVYVASFGLAIPVVNTEHNVFERPVSAPMGMVAKFKKMVVNRIYNHVTVLTSRDADIAQRYIRNVSLMPNPLAFDLADDNVFDSKKKIVLASGRLDVWHCKGFDLLIKAWASARRPGWKLMITGGGGDGASDHLRSMAENLGVSDSVVFTGFVDDAVRYYRDASIFVLSSRYEGFGMVLIEAMSQGCACIAADYGGRQREIFGDVATGIAVDVEHSEPIADALGHLMDDDAARLAMGRAAIQRSAVYLPDRVIDRWESVFKRLNLPRR